MARFNTHGAERRTGIDFFRDLVKGCGTTEDCLRRLREYSRYAIPGAIEIVELCKARQSRWELGGKRHASDEAARRRWDGEAGYPSASLPRPGRFKPFRPSPLP